MESSCSRCHLRSVCVASGLTQDQLAEIDLLTRAKRRVGSGAALFRRGDRFESLYAIRSGSFKSTGIAPTQYGKVTGLHLPAELLGLDAIRNGVHEYTAIALEDSEVCVLPYTQLTRLMLSLPELQTHVLRALSGDIMRDGGLMLRLGAMTAQQRVVGFLLGLSNRYQSLGYASTRFSLRMMREDIASYLGITIETTSRIFSRLQRDGLIQARNKDVEITNFNGLRELLGY
jgi:CRP/FNR family transcriptional regulator